MCCRSLSSTLSHFQGLPKWLWQHLGNKPCCLHARAWPLHPTHTGDAPLCSPPHVPSAVSTPWLRERGRWSHWAQARCCAAARHRGDEHGPRRGTRMQMMALSLFTGVHLATRFLPSAYPPSRPPYQEPSGLGSFTKNWLE